MIFDGFIFKNGYVLVVGNNEYDLHNDYDWVDCSFDSDEACARILLRRSSGDGAGRSQPASFELQFCGVTRFISREGDPALASDSQTAAFVGFLFPDNVECMDGYLDEQTEEGQDFIVCMEDSSAFKIHAAEVILNPGA